MSRNIKKSAQPGNGGGVKVGTDMSGRYPIDDLTYDLLTVMHAKAKALEAYDKYIEDARGNEEVRRFLEQLREQDVRMVHELRGYLGRLFQQEQSRGRRVA